MSGRRVRNTRAIMARRWAARGVAATTLIASGTFVLGAFAPHEEPTEAAAAAVVEAEAGADVITAAAHETEIRVSRDAERAPLTSVDAGATTTMWVKSSSTVIRAAADADSAQMAKVKKRGTVQATGEKAGDWTQVVHNELPRWVLTKDLANKKPPLEPEEGGINTGPCSRMAGIDGGLQPAARKATRAVCHRFPDIQVYGGRQPRGTHGTGHSVDIMVSGKRGHEIARFLQSRAAEFDLYYLIYEQKIWFNGRGDAWRGMADRGGVTANHYDHIHLTVRGG